MIFQSTLWNPAHSSNIFGVYWDGSVNSAMLRTDGAEFFTEPSPAINNGTGSSPFDEIMPWAGMEIVEDAQAGTLVSIPKFWYKWTRNAETAGDMKLQISSEQQDGFFVSPAHADRGDGVGERDVVYIGRYHCASGYKSQTGVVPLANQTRDTFRQGIHGLGTNIWQFDFAMYWTICMLYLVEFADWNSQGVIGGGCSDSGSIQNMGLTDSMTYHTGTTATAIGATNYGHVQYRHIEDLWANVCDWCDGIYFSGASVYGIKNPSQFSDTTNGTLIGTRPTSPGVPQSFNEPTSRGLEYALYPATVDGTDYTVRTCDRCDYGSNGVVLSVGGNYYKYQDYGLFALDGYASASYQRSLIGSRLMKLP